MHVSNLPHRGNMLVEKIFNNAFCSVGATCFHGCYSKCLSNYCTYGAKKYGQLLFYQHLALNGADFLKRQTQRCP